MSRSLQPPSSSSRSPSSHHSSPSSPSKRGETIVSRARLNDNDNDDDARTSVGTEQRHTARPVKPLGSARRPARSRTPTPNNPHPAPSSPSPRGTPPRFATTSRPEASPTLLTPNVPANGAFSSNAGGLYGFHADRLTGGRSTRRATASAAAAAASSPSPLSAALPSGSVAFDAAERRPWFPYPSNSASAALSSSLSKRADGARDIPRTGKSEQQRRSPLYKHSPNESGPSSLSSSASSYNSDDLTSLSARGRRAFSAEPEDWSQAVRRGRRLSRMPNGVVGATIEEAVMDPADKASARQEHVGVGSGGASSSDDDEKERAHFQSVMKAFDSYLAFSLAANNARRRSFYALPRSHRLLLSSLGPTLPGPQLEDSRDAEQITGGRGFKARLDEIDDRIRRNADVLAQIVADSRGFLGGESEEDERASLDDTRPSSRQKDFTGELNKEGSQSREAGKSSSSESERSRKRAANHDVDKVRSTIKQFVRDWSTLGAHEREAAYDPILEALEENFAHVSSAQRSQLRVLVPGAGLGRLAFEVAWLGFGCQGNEFSFYMLLASHFILNKTTRVHEHTVYPFVHSSSNWRTANDMLRPVQIPDVNPSDLPSHVDFSMVAGEFVEVYSKEQERHAWDAIATCFFIDTARNFARYLEVINHVLPIGGAWINVGPLLWHYEGSASQGSDVSVELTLDEVMGLIELMGFVVEKRKTLAPQAYTDNAKSMLTYEYSPEFWQARKVRDVTPASEV